MAAVGFALLFACTNAYLYDQQTGQKIAADRSVSLVGHFCTLGANDVVRPIKILLAMDASQSMKVTDPDGSRATALVQLLQNLPRDPEVFISVMLFAGSTTVWLTNQNQPGFVPVTQITPNDELTLESEILNYTNPQSNRDSTDFVKPLADIYAAINSDISKDRQDPTTADARSRYSVIFLSDGHPTIDEDDQLIEGDAVRRIYELRDLAESVTFNTVHVFDPVQPVSSVCDLSPTDGGVPECPLLIINQDAQRLEEMAEIGGGMFRDFRNNEPINFLSFHFGEVRRSYVIKDLVADDRNAPAGSPLDQADSDEDGLTDAEELKLGTDPLKRDTDGDGFSDGVEIYFAKEGAPFNPTQQGLPDGGGLDPGCPLNLRGVDSDCDGLLDCDEQLIGTNATLQDSDGDGIPDAVEWQLGTQGSSIDLDEDPDGDGVSNRDEVRRHTDPLTIDTDQLTTNGYRYQMTEDGPPEADGKQCYSFRVDNVLLAPTLADTRDGGTGKGAGFNEITLTLAMVPADDPTARTVVRTFRSITPRYPIGGVESPPDGVLTVNPEDFVPACSGQAPLGL